MLWQQSFFTLPDSSSEKKTLREDAHSRERYMSLMRRRSARAAFRAKRFVVSVDGIDCEYFVKMSLRLTQGV